MYDKIDGVPAINNILSNVLYIIFGCSFIYFVKYRQSITEWSKSLSSPKGSKGVEIIESKTSPAPPLPPLLRRKQKNAAYDKRMMCTTQWACLSVWKGSFQSIYHICPTPTTVQFDFTFIIISVLLLSFALYKKRHSHLAGFESPLQFLALVATMVAMNGALQVMSGGDGSSGSCALRAVFTSIYVVLVILVGICLRRRWMLSSFLYKPRQRFQILIHDFCSWLGLSKNEEEMSVKLEDTPKDEEEERKHFQNLDA